MNGLDKERFQNDCLRFFFITSLCVCQYFQINSCSKYLPYHLSNVYNFEYPFSFLPTNISYSPPLLYILLSKYLSTPTKINCF